ncbi:ATP-binding protein [Paraburkholderia sp. RL17-337-BIB-A]|uniref:ATP-binding protein n=1 Tax=Paraburkholderia sp. RL17-337-BIB-A TaxID=3031636 RepID=UPI0038B98459
MARWHIQLQAIRPPVLRYGFAVVCVGIALGLALACQHYGFHDAEMPLFDLAIVLVTWYAGIGPSALAVFLSGASNTYFFTPPLYTFEITSEDLPYLVLFTVWSAVIASFVAIRRRIEDQLLDARDRLQIELEVSRQREDEILGLNQTLARRAAELEASNKELESFSYSVSHDLRAPIRHIVGFSELLQKHTFSSLDDKSRRYIQTILESAKRMGDLIDDLLAFSRIGRIETKMTFVSLELLVKEVIADVGQDVRDRDIFWDIKPLPVCYGDRSMLRMVIVNLVSNAVKFTSKRAGAKIEIGCVDVNENELEMFVKDNGAGFDMEYVDKLFGVFQRLHLAEQFEGTGIGLAIVQRIIVRHGGKVRAEGMLDRGATFYFSLPKARDATTNRIASIL